MIEGLEHGGDTGVRVLALPMGENDADAATVRDYLKALLSTLWREEEGFSGKRPFGNSSWQREVLRALVKADMVGGDFDEDGYLEGVDIDRADSLIQLAIRSL